jgi:hypothetical protein
MVLCWSLLQFYCSLFLSVGFMVQQGHARQVFILHKNFWPPPLFSCTKIPDPSRFPQAPPPLKLMTGPLRTWWQQACSNLLLEHVCINLVGTTIIVHLQGDNNLFQTCHNNWEQGVRTHPDIGLVSPSVCRYVATFAFLHVNDIQHYQHNYFVKVTAKFHAILSTLCLYLPLINHVPSYQWEQHVLPCI